MSTLAAVVMPFIDIIYLVGTSYFQQAQNKTNTDLSNSNENSNFNDLVFITAFLATSTFLRPVLIRYVAESVKVSLKKEHVKKLLDVQNKFLISANHLDAIKNIVSLQEVTVGFRADDYATACNAFCMNLPISLMSIACGIVRINMVTNFLENESATIALPMMAGYIFVSYGAAHYIAKYEKANNTYNSSLLAKASIIENNKEAITLMDAIGYERQQMDELLINRGKTITPVITLQCLSTISSVGIRPLINYYLVTKSDYYMSVASFMYLTAATFMLTIDVEEVIKILGTDRVQFNDHASKIRTFNSAYEQWLEIYSQRDILTVYNKSSLTLWNFNVSIKGHTHRLSDASNTSDFTDEKELEELTSMQRERHSSVSEGNIDLLTNVNIDLPSNEIYLLMGKSGIGKTTFLKSIFDCWPFASGSITSPVSKEDICYIPQKLYLPPNASLLEILVYPRIVQEIATKMKQSHEEFIATIRSYLNEAGLVIDNLEEKVPNWEGMLSGGEKQKLAIISAIIKQPKLLIMDEIAANLDLESKIVMYNMIKNNLTDATIIFTDHNPIPGFATKFLKIIGGKLVKYDTFSPSQSYDSQGSNVTEQHSTISSNADEHERIANNLLGGEAEIEIVGI